MTEAPQLLNRSRCFGGTVEFYQHRSQFCNGEMRFSIYRPPQAASQAVPVLYFLSGLTCTEENFMTKAGAQQFAAKAGLMLVAPDTSPRNSGIPGEEDDWDFGTGAGFYVDATQEPWKRTYQMYSYVTQELPALLAEHFPIQPDRQGIMGHSMGGHGALVCAFKNPDRYRSVSAFAPIVAPMQCPWGQKAFRNYLGENPDNWKEYDASELIQKGQSQTGQSQAGQSQAGQHQTGQWQRPILIDQGTADNFLEKQLMPDRFQAACDKVGQPLTLRMQDGYDHSYYFISSFIEDHIRHHAAALQSSF